MVQMQVHKDNGEQGILFLFFMFCSIGPSSSGLIFRFQGSKVLFFIFFFSFCLFFRSLYCSNSSFLLDSSSSAFRLFVLSF
ncbi:hypothetical protein GLOIN_2v1597162 [Rhizophagus irregularis DAOM 181602=DAOM 197198]|uniref:Uncharacterized protein n=1 Tax=Rhizophagus irregularis (strain DAOM 181602 / DAOM 197198 / MUCL 43194) TaxID=747089 RepID=A0A2P4PWU4_RHIID|nr:hypothetical protein GLOIN_2v1622612 [Rhizophagus irregularis DAOM 181602=DAOM 197198]XP_025179283.1 hypothetical protein GLOIN_2v1597162 [Rhizophagus irregularis DAOM 181602=DAOM 197198]POG69853.1 hypothetical protein GLOIN_2v1622612 [Rhizophagus irregularis DAOM 181602=DAOM 197198]POG72417.1 hypothetical protein GLOIN_2v1597162 [Rhizophagus irregularis DAOM 181602=DAOM 197198]|eukprot:XP_025176719.1 hypothetical protein GLOIN_2v1622612 [Rhizophagus irregularis DAOM 181602=DAOM 197198]